MIQPLGSQMSAKDQQCYADIFEGLREYTPAGSSGSTAKSKAISSGYKDRARRIAKIQANIEELQSKTGEKPVKHETPHEQFDKLHSQPKIGFLYVKHDNVLTVD